MSKTPIQLVSAILELHPNTKVRNIKIETAKELGQDYLLHITTNKFPELIPIISKRAAPDENNDLLRCHVSATILDCIQGYGRLFDHIINLQASIDRDDDTGVLYKGGMYILKTKFDVCLKPGKRLVESAVKTDERWLISYSKETATYPVTCVGRIIPLDITIIPNGKDGISKQSSMAIEITDSDGIYLNNKDVLNKGYYLVSLLEDPKKDKLGILDLKTISKEDFDKQTKYKTVMLSHVDKPIYSKW